MRSTFTFNGHSCDEFGIYISKKPNINRSQRKFQSASVAGRNGNIYQLQDAWDEVVVTYDIFAGGYEQGDAPSDFTDIMEWLNSADDYARLEDSYDTEHYRMAVFVDATNIEQKWYSTGQAQIKFRCKPQHFLDIPDVDVNNLRNYYMGEIVSFDGDGQNLENLTAEIKAVQDLHGYDYPWVGGAGKNKLQNTATSKTSVGITTTVNADGTVSLSGTASDLLNELIGTIELNAGTTYYISGCPSGGGTTTYELRVRDANYHAYAGDYGTGMSFTVPSDGTYYVAFIIRQGANVSNKLLKPMVCLSTAPNPTTFEPYSNICPIVGWDEVSVDVRGRNMLKIVEQTRTASGVTATVNEDGTITVNGTATASTVVLMNLEYYTTSSPAQNIGKKCIPNGRYTVSMDAPNNNYRFQVIASNNASGTDGIATIISASSGEFTIDDAYAYNWARLYIQNGTVANNVVLKPMLRFESDTDTTFEPYNGQTYAIDLNGTRYGGTLDVTTGVLTVTWKYITLDGVTSHRKADSIASSQGLYYSICNITDDVGINTISGKTALISDQFIERAQVQIGNCYITYNGTYLVFVLADQTLSTLADINNWLAQNTPSMCYELATPQTVQLTPQQVKTLVGENNIWVDSGEVDVVTAPSIANPTNHVALPIITLTGAGASSLLDLEKDSPDHNESGMPYYFSELLPCFGAVLTGISGSQRYVSMFTDEYAEIDKLRIVGRQNSTGHVSFTAMGPDYGVGTAIEVNPNTDYTISASTNRPCTVQVLFFTGTVGLITSEAHASNNGGDLRLTFRTPSDCSKILIAFFTVDSTTITVSSIMVNKGTEALPFRAFTTDTSEIITIKDTTLKILMNGFKTAVIDCERENFSVDGADSNTSVSVLDQYGNLSDEYLKIDKGRNKVAYSDGIVSVMLKPRFWEL